MNQGIFFVNYRLFKLEGMMHAVFCVILSLFLLVGIQFYY